MNDDDAIDALRTQLVQLKDLHAQGTLHDAAYEAARVPLERKLVDAVLAAKPASSRAPRKLMAALSVGVVALAMAGYWWTGAPHHAATGTPAAGEEAAADPDGDAHATTFEQISGMAERLAQRLKEHPDDAMGWAMLGRSYAVLGRNDDAIPAYEHAIALRGDDAALLADYADALAVRNQRNLSGEPLKIVLRALKLEPGNIKALSLAGSEAFNRKDYAAAAAYWDKLVQLGTPDNPLVQYARDGLAQARELGRLPAGASEAAPAAASVQVSGKVTLAAALASQAGPDDTVFIVARAAEGPRMPLAVLRRHVKDLPLEFTLDDSLAMSPALKLSSFPKVVVSARVSKSGDAVPASGDLLGQSGPVAVGSKGLAIVIGEVVKK